MLKKIKSFCAVIASVATISAFGQTPPTLDLHLFAGVNITGATGSVYAVQCTSDIAQSNSWTSLAFVQLPTTNHLWVDTSASVGDRRFYRAVQLAAPTNMVYIPPNSFVMGSPTNEINRRPEDGPQTTVILTRGFWIGKYEVTQREYFSITTNDPSFFPTNFDAPISSVTWIDATNYCAKLTQQELAAGRIPAGSAYRLPTEAEWEYAARAGTSTRFFFGDDASTLTNYAWFSDNAGFKINTVGQKPPNPWGLYDIEGNVWEWCSDWYSDNLLGGIQVDPKGPASNAIGVKVMRGGAYDFFESDCRSARRYYHGQVLTDTDLGFRVVLAVAEP